jgi:hypothetical protein
MDNDTTLPAPGRWPAVEPVRAETARHETTGSRAVRGLIVLVAVYGALPVIVLQPIIDPDLWWHLRTGDWILQHRAVPWIDEFSSYGHGRLWIAYSWLFEVILSGLYRAFGLFGPLVYVTVLSLAITLALHRFIMHFERRITRSAALTALGLAAMSSTLVPRSFLFSILFYIVVLHVVFIVRESKSARPLLVLPPLFALWANLHVLFVYGLLALGFAIAESLIYRFFPGQELDAAPRSAPLAPLVLATLASGAATLLTPYHFHLHWSIIDLARQAGIYDWVIDVMAMDFRQRAHWFVLALTLGAAFLCGRQRRVEPFPVLLIVSGAFFAFRARRDVWVVVVAALAMVAQYSPGRTRREGGLTRRSMCAAAIGIAAAFVGTALYRDISPRAFEAVLAKEYPAAAAQVVEARGYTGPLFNNYNWGGYLIWRLPQLPVIMDGRSNLHGDDRIRRSIATWRGSPAWASDPELAASNLVIAPIDVALTSLLRRDRRFELVYEDQVAAVFVARPERGSYDDGSTRKPL